MLARVAAGELPLALVRRVLAILIATAMVLAPVGAASAHDASVHKSHHAVHHDHGAMQMAESTDKISAAHCAHKTAGGTCCCHDKGACAQTCLQKCFGQLAVMPPSRAARVVLAFRVAPRLADRLPGLASAPQLPPPRA
jgi:hypothetical protein